jgi:hypothetical protein
MTMKQMSIVVSALSLVLALGSCSTNRSEKSGSASEAKWTGHVTSNFDSDHTGTLPAGWTGAETHGRGTPAHWTVDQSTNGSGNVLRLAETKNSGSTFNMLLSSASYPADVELEAKIRADGGNEDRGGGLVWRANDANNYYVARWNPLEGNLGVYKVLNGQRSELQSTNIDTDANAWHKLEVRQRGANIVVEFDGTKKLDCDDDAITVGGKVGFWTKADAASSFDEFEVEFNR